MRFLIEIKNRNKKSWLSGFTLAELMIAVGLFTVVVTIGSGSVLGLLNTNNRSQSISAIMNNLNYSVESISRTIRFGRAYHCGSGGVLTVEASCANGDTFLAVTNNGVVTAFRLNGSTIEQSVGGAAYKPVTASSVNIQYVRFYTFNTTPGDTRQPYVILVLKGYTGSNVPSQSYFDLETLISQRQLDI